MNLERISEHIAERNASDSGEPVVTSMIIIGVMSVIALAVFIALGDAMADRADDVANDIRDSGTHVGS